MKMQINIEDKRACLVSISSFENVAQEGSFFIYYSQRTYQDRPYISIFNTSSYYICVGKLRQLYLDTIKNTEATKWLPFNRFPVNTHTLLHWLLRHSMIARLEFQNSFLAQIAFASFCFLRNPSAVHGALRSLLYQP